MHSPVALNVILGSVWFLLQSSPVLAAEITLHARDSALVISGELVSSDQGAWVVAVPDVGNLTLNSEFFECVRGPCEDSQVTRSPVSIPPGVPLSTTWVGGSAIGTEVMPRLIKAFAASVSATVTTKVGADVRNLEFTLHGADGRLVGRINVNRQGEQAGLAALAKGDADVVWGRRPILPDGAATDATTAADVPLTVERHAWAQDALTVLVAKDNPVVSLSLDDIAKIFAGQIEDWGELGLPPGKINVYAPSSEMGTWAQFDSQVLKPRDLALTSEATRLTHATQWSDRVAADRYGIGVSPLAYVRHAKAIKVAMSCGLVAAPSLFAAKAGEYPLVGQLYFYSAAPLKNPLAAALLAFATSREAQPILKAARLIDRDPEVVQFGDQAARIAAVSDASSRSSSLALLQSLFEGTREAQRLSITFRFDSAETKLDAQGLNDIVKLALLVASREASGKSVMLLGFADSVGSYQSNLSVAGGRAASVYNALLRVLGTALPKDTSIKHSAYGALAPVSCEETTLERAPNRRVEVWIR